jgi:hypothetical protein
MELSGHVRRFKICIGRRKSVKISHQFRHQKVLGFISKLGLAQPIPYFILHKPNFNHKVQYVVLVHYCARTLLLAPPIISSLHGSRQAPPGQRAFAWSGSATALKSTRGAGIFCNRHSLCFPVPSS